MLLEIALGDWSPETDLIEKSGSVRTHRSCDAAGGVNGRELVTAYGAAAELDHFSLREKLGLEQILAERLRSGDKLKQRSIVHTAGHVARPASVRGKSNDRVSYFGDYPAFARYSAQISCPSSPISARCCQR